MEATRELDPTRLDGEALRAQVREEYGRKVTAAVRGEGSCCASSCCTPDAADPITGNLYGEHEAATLPSAAVAASFGCGNPTALAELAAGEVVLDLGSGGGIDVLLSARRVGPSGFAYGLDMTPEMLELARRNQREAGVANVAFLEGTMEAVPLPDAAVDVIISNCVVNLAADKGVVLREAARVLRPGGRLAISDIVLRKPLPEPLRRSVELWIGCVAGALEEGEYLRALAEAGFVDASIEPTRVFSAEDARLLAPEIVAGLGDEELGALDGAVASAFVRARRPV
jgi:SAM-dependent methyltransferase